MIPAQDDRNWEEVLSYLPADYRELAVEHKQLELQYGNAKIRDAEQLLRLIFLHVGLNLPLRQTVAWVAESGGPEVSAMRLHMKMRRAAPYLQSLVQRMIQPSMAARPELWGGYDLLAIDATVVTGPGSVGTDARLHTALRLSDLSLVHVEVTDETGGETLKRFPLGADQLAIVDRGYSTAAGINAALQGGADVLVRVNRGALPLYQADDSSVNVLAYLRTLSGHRAQEWSVKTQVDKKVTISGRLIAIRLPAKEAAEARARVARELGADASLESLEAAGYVALFTTVPVGRLSAARCIETYRLRWQVELLFKRWKSICGFDQLPNYRDDTIRSWLYAKVLLGLILDHMGSTPADVFQSGRGTGTGARCDSSDARPLAVEPWKLTKILWPALVSAIVPSSLLDTLSTLSSIVTRLAVDSPQTRPRQIAEYRENYVLAQNC